MDFGLFFLMQRDEAWTESAVYESALDQIAGACFRRDGRVAVQRDRRDDQGQRVRFGRQGHGVLDLLVPGC